MSRYRLYQVDAFTTERFQGNPAGVVPNADGLTAAEMQVIARELNNSETAFIHPPDAPDHDVLVRFFTPTTEVPSCGHATIAAHYVRAVENALPSCTVVQKIGAGIGSRGDRLAGYAQLAHTRSGAAIGDQRSHRM
jgi:PhzF family phenazine biosynthesis protein